MQLGLPRSANYHLQRIISTREADAADRQLPATLADLEAYAEGTASQLLTLQVWAWPPAQPPSRRRARRWAGSQRCWRAPAGCTRGCRQRAEAARALQCKASGAGGSETDHAASHMGKAVGMVALLRGTAHHAQRCARAQPAAAAVLPAG